MTTDKEIPNPRVKPVYEDGTELDLVLYDGEDAGIYRAFRARMHDALDAVDEAERMLVNGIVNDHWDAARLRRLLPKFVAACEPQGLAGFLATLPIAADVRTDLVEAFALGGAAAMKRVADALASTGHDLETVRAHTIATRIDEIGKLNAIIANLERRRDRAMRDLAQRQRARRNDDKRSRDAH